MTLTATSAGTRVLVVISGEGLSAEAARAAVDSLTALVEELPIEVHADGAGLVVAIPVKPERPALA